MIRFKSIEGERVTRFGFLVFAAAITVAGCASVSVSTGVPVLTKSGTGTLISETEGLPDIERGRQARVAGKPQEALKDLEPLARKGYPDAQMLAAAADQDLGTVAGEADALKWYRLAREERPDADLSIARLLVNTGEREHVPEILQLLDSATARDDIDEPIVRLQLYGQYPDLDTTGQALKIAREAANSNDKSQQTQAIGWYRQNIGDGDNGQVLERLCRQHLDIDSSCYSDLAYFYRFRGEREKLDKLVDEALQVLGKDSVPKITTGSLYRPITSDAVVAAQLASAMVAEVLDVASEGDEEEAEQQKLAPGFEDDDFEGDKQALPSVKPLPRAEGREPVAAAGKAGTEKSDTAIIELADKVLRWMLKRKGEYELQAAMVAVRFPFLIPDVDVAKIIQVAAAEGNPTAVSALADLYYGGQRGISRPFEAFKLYKQCLAYTSTRLSAHGRLARIYAMGLVGPPDPHQALFHFLEAARGGSPRAYGSLARMFAGSRPGISINRVNAYVFARRAADAGRPVVTKVKTLVPAPSPDVKVDADNMFKQVDENLLDRLKKEMTATELAQAEVMYEKEKSFRPYLKQPVPADIYSRRAASE